MGENGAVLVVASQPLVRKGIIASLEEAGELEAHAVGSVTEAHAVLTERQPSLSVVVLDPPFPAVSMEEVCAHLITACPETATLALVGNPDQAQVALRSGARGVLTTEVTPDALQAALRQVDVGQVVVAPDLLPALAGTEPSAPDEHLTDRELLALQLVSRGYTSKQIAPLLDTTAKAVDLTLNRAAKRLGARHRPEAVAMALRQGLIT
ncbi:MAG TPA: response regulator transcription factor [Chloroflexota bacterium]|nr:response regulator transcription factor [Chloroflexota bacterium]